MPCFAALEHTAAADRADTHAVVEVLGRDGQPAYALPYAQLEEILDRAGFLPSEAHVLIRNVEGEDDVPANVVLDERGELAPANLPGGTRVQVRADGEILFRGTLAKREEMGRAAAVRLVFLDDRSRLAALPVRGALVHDQEDALNPVKFVPALPCRFNPEGLGNCVEVNRDGVPWPVPLFLPRGLGSAKLDAPLGSPTFWTPERALRYLWYLLTQHVFSAAHADVARLDTQAVSWRAETLSLPPGALQRKLPDLRVQGWSVAAVLEKLCELSGAYGWRLRYRPGGSEISFYPRVKPKPPADQSAASPWVAPAGLALPLQRSGAASDCKTAYDFHAQTDYTDLAAAVVIEGAPYEIEAEFKYEDSDADTLEPAWTEDEEQSFADIICGDDTYAQIGDALMDGSGGRPLVYARTRAALSLARQHYPRPFRAWRLKVSAASLETILKGHAGALESFATDLLKWTRPIGRRQVQPILTPRAGSTELAEVDGNDHVYPVRIQVSRDGDGGPYHQVLAPSGLRVTDDGTLWLEGLGDDLARDDNLYEGSLIRKPEEARLKHLKLNAVVRHDARLKAVTGLFAPNADPNGIRQELDEGLCLLGTGPQYYALDPEGFHEQHQVNSSPSAGDALGGEPLPLNRVLASDAEDLAAHAERRLEDKARTARAQSWRLIGIRPEFRAGDFVERVVFLGPGGPSGERAINAPIRQVIFQFDGAQFTEVQIEGM